MKSIYLSLFLGAIFIAGGSKAQAQVLGELKASIPFDFHAGGATLPAGNYTIHVLESPQQNMVQIRNDDDNRDSALLDTTDAWAHTLPKTPELLFNHTGSDYYLSKIFDQDDRDGAAVWDSGSSKKETSAPRRDQRHIATLYKFN